MVTQLVRNWWLLALRGLLSVFFGMAAFLWPGITLAVLVMLFGVYALVDGIFAVVAAIHAATHKERWLAILTEGIAGIIAGLVTFFSPGITALALVYLIAVWAIITGV